MTMNKIDFKLNAKKNSILCGAKTEGELQQYLLLSNTGDKVDVGGYDLPLVIDFSGVRFTRDKIPILIEHDTDRRFGHSTSLNILHSGEKATCLSHDITGPMIYATCVRSGDSDNAKEIETELNNGLPFQVSVGGYIEEMERFDGKKDGMTVNGIKMSGRFLIARKTVIQEISICMFGADDKTSVELSLKKGKLEMNFTTWLTEAGFEEGKLTEKQNSIAKILYEKGVSPAECKTILESSVIIPTPTPSPTPEPNDNHFDEVKRLEGIKTIKEKYAERFKNRKFKQNGKEKNFDEVFNDVVDDVKMTAKDFELFCMKENLKSETVPTPNFQMKDQTVDADVLTINLLREMGRVPESAQDVNTGKKYGIEHWFSEKAIDRANNCREYQHISIHSVLQYAIKMATGCTYPGQTIGSSQFLREATEAVQYLKMKNYAERHNGFGMASTASTVDISRVWDDVGNKEIEAAFRLVETSWQKWVATKNVRDFRPVHIYGIERTGLLTPLGHDGSFERGGMAESERTVVAQTYGRMEGISRNQLINDDVGALDMLWSSLGSLAPRTYEEVVYATFLGNLDTMFNATIGNKATTGSELSYDGICLTNALAGKRVTADGSPILSSPKYLLVGNTLEMRAKALMYDDYVNWNTKSKNAPTTKNNVQRMFEVIKTPYIDNTLIKQKVNPATVGESFPGQSSTEYFLMPDANDPNGTPIVACFLNGNKIPTVESEQADFERLGMQWRCYTDFGVNIWKPESAVMATGEAAA